MSDWTETALGEVVKVSRVRMEPRDLGEQVVAHYSIPAFDDGRRPVFEPASSIKSQKFTVPQDSVLVSMLNPRIPRVWRVQGSADAVCSTEFAVLSPTDPNVLLVDHLDVVCRSSGFTEMLDERSTGTTGSRKRAKAADALTYRVALPPLDEQRRIVDVMAAVDAHVNALRVEEDAARASLEALRNDIFAGAGELVALSSVLETARSGGTPSRQRPEYYGGEFFWLKSGEVNSPNIVATEETITEAGLSGSSAWLVPASAVVVAMYGATAAEVGYVASPMATNQAVLALVANERFASPRFLFHWMLHESPRLKMAATGAAQPNLSKTTILREVGFPKLDLARQKSAESALDAMLAVVTAVALEAVTLQEVRSSLLSVLLSGETTISEAYDDLLDAS